MVYSPLGTVPKEWSERFSDHVDFKEGPGFAIGNIDLTVFPF